MKTTMIAKDVRAALMMSLAAMGLGACGQKTTDAETKDIYVNDAETRTVATAEQMAWTVSLGGCSGSMLTPKYVLTASHCSPRAGATYTSGAALAAGQRGDLRVVRVVENNGSLDYAIAEVSWVNGQVNPKQRFTPFIVRSRDEITTGKDGGATTALFTVGFPGDKRSAMHAVGYAKRWGTSVLYYNLGSINGNSGGAVWTMDKKALVSMTNAGPHMLGQAGWNNNSLENPNAWNWGAAMPSVYAASAVMKEVFPDGDNKYVDDEGHAEAL